MSSSREQAGHTYILHGFIMHAWVGRPPWPPPKGVNIAQKLWLGEVTS